MIKNILLITTVLPLGLLQCTIILINGTSCSGKSSTVQEIIKQNKAHGLETVSTSIDDAFKVIACEEFRENVNKNLKSLSSKLDGYETCFSLWHEEIFRLQKDKPQATIIVDHFFSLPNTFSNMLHVWNKSNRSKLFFVKLFCMQQIAEKRLIQRNGSSDMLQHRHEFTVKSHFNPKTLARVHGDKCYDLELDNSHLTPTECAQRISASISNTKNFDGFANSFDLQNRGRQNFQEYDSIIGTLAHKMAAEYQKKDPADLWKITFSN